MIEKGNKALTVPIVTSSQRHAHRSPHLTKGHPAARAPLRWSCFTDRARWSDVTSRDGADPVLGYRDIHSLVATEIEAAS